MRSAYFVLGIGFLILIIGAYYLWKEKEHTEPGNSATTTATISSN